MVTKERDEELALFFQMRRREMESDELNATLPVGRCSSVVLGLVLNCCECENFVLFLVVDADECFVSLQSQWLPARPVRMSS